VLRAASDKKFCLRGYAASFNTLSKDLGGYRERIAPGAFSSSLDAGDDVVALFNHSANVILGRRSAKTLSVGEDERGLAFSVQLDPQISAHRDIYASVQRGDVNECSFAFQIPDGGDDWDEAKDERGQRFARRTIKRCKLLDVSVVTNPAYGNGATSVSARSADYTPTADWYADALNRARAIGVLVANDIAADE
jgi:HK97 family phage prohead protease